MEQQPPEQPRSLIEEIEMDGGMVPTRQEALAMAKFHAERQEYYELLAVEIAEEEAGYGN